MASQDDEYLNDFGKDVDNYFATETYSTFGGNYVHRFKNPKLEAISITIGTVIFIIILLVKVL